MYYDEVALANRKGGRKTSKVYALRHIPTGLYFHSRIKKYWRTEDNYYTAPYPMFRKSKSAFSFWLKEFRNPQDWQLIEQEFEG